MDDTREISGKEEQVIFDVQNDPRFNQLEIADLKILNFWICLRA